MRNCKPPRTDQVAPRRQFQEHPVHRRQVLVPVREPLVRVEVVKASQRLDLLIRVVILRPCSSATDTTRCNHGSPEAGFGVLRPNMASCHIAMLRSVELKTNQEIDGGTVGDPTHWASATSAEARRKSAVHDIAGMFAD